MFLLKHFMAGWFNVFFDGEGGGGGGEAAAAAAAAAPAKPWYEGNAGVDERMVGHWKNHYPGKELDPAAIAIEATRSHLEAVKLIGAPPQQLLRLPTDTNDKAGWDAVWKRLGRPDDATGYEFKTGDGKTLAEVNASLDKAMREAAIAGNLPKDTAAMVAASLAKAIDAEKASALEEHNAKITEEAKKLDTDWGANKAANMLVAKSAATKLGVDVAAVEALEGKIGYAAVMQMFHKIGCKIGEAKFVESNSITDTVMTVGQAKAEKDMLKADQNFVTRYLNGDAEAVRKMTALDTIIAG